MGECTNLEKEDYTLVLKGMIDLSMAVFPKGTAGCQIDALARMPLWKAKRNFGHGTGHGIGYYLCVHEGPQEFRQNFNQYAILPGMVMTDEPGIYFIPALIDEWKAKGLHKDFINYDLLETYKDFGGIRIEDDILITKDGCRFIGDKLIPYHIDEVEAFIKG